MKKESIEKILEQGTPRQKIFLLFADMANQSERAEVRYLTEEEKSEIRKLINTKKIKEEEARVYKNYLSYQLFRNLTEMEQKELLIQTQTLKVLIEGKLWLDNFINVFNQITKIYKDIIPNSKWVENKYTQLIYFDYIVKKQFEGTEIGEKLRRMVKREPAIKALELISRDINLPEAIAMTNQKIEDAKEVVETIRAFILKLLPVPVLAKKLKGEEAEILKAIEETETVIERYLNTKEKLPPKQKDKYQLLKWKNIDIQNETIEENLKNMIG